MSAAFNLVLTADRNLTTAKDLLFVVRAHAEAKDHAKAAIERYATEANWLATHDPMNHQRANAMAYAVAEIVRCYKVTLPRYVTA